MGDTPFDFVEAIAGHSAGFAAAAEANLDAEVKHCPGWKVTDLVVHMTSVQWFWATIAEERLSEQPDDSRRPAPAERDELIGTFKAGADRLVSVLREADPTTSVWTWAPAQRDIAFITRHQVQEAAVHHWDAVNAAGGTLVIGPQVAVDAVSEFLTFSVSSDADPAEHVRPALDGRFALGATDADGAAWTVSDGEVEGTIAFGTTALPDVPAITATASDLLLWLYGRVDLDTSALPDGLAERFRALCFTT